MFFEFKNSRQFSSSRSYLHIALFFSIIWKPLQSQEFMCCSEASGICKEICEKISLTDLAVSKKNFNETFKDLEKSCPVNMLSFWECFNGTFIEISRGESWSGRVCCPLPQNENCRRACLAATSIYDLTQGCRMSDEIEFFSCLDRQYIGDECCSHAREQDCKDSCLDIFRSDLTPSRQQRKLVQEMCQLTSPKVLNCVANFTKLTPATNLRKQVKCCDKSQKYKCKMACKDLILTQKHNDTTLQEIFDALQIGGCGPPLLQDELWQCFINPIDTLPLSSALAQASRIDLVGMDSAKWHCCQKAATNECKKLCSKTFTKDWSLLWDDFYYKCLSKTSQEDLKNCIEEVDEPCELGCDGLSFCTNFNNRPTELFRSCTAQADEAARNDFSLWQSENRLNLHELILPLKNGTKCSPHAWKSVACALEIKPCSRRSHGNRICKDICLDMMTECADWTQIPKNYSPQAVCTMLSADGDDDGDSGESCVDLKSFFEPPKDKYFQQEVSSPCKGDICGEGQLCIVNKTCIWSSGPCLSYKCIPGCKLGEVSEYMVPEGSYVRIPIPNNHHRGCLKICKCTKKGLDQCQPLPCILLSSCWMGDRNEEKKHGQIFQVDCNRCVCYAGEIICSKRQCQSSAISGINTGYTTLPCNCPPHFVPVCGKNGNVYASACLARCAGLGDSDIEYGACQDPCKHNPCPVGKKCVPDVKVCLSVMHKPCTQYQCINGNTNCSELPWDPVCDVDNRQHSNACYLAHNNQKLPAYRGSCIENCNFRGGEVCGSNGRTYVSECAAFADYVSVDYKGSCVAIGLIKDVKESACPGVNVKCKPLVDRNCFGVTPPGSCCPVCGGSLRVLYSKKQIDRALYALQNKSKFSLTLRALLMALERHIQVAQCTLRGYLTVELDIFLLVQSTVRNPDRIQQEACVREAEKLGNLINKRSPRVVSELSLSSLIAATVLHTQQNNSSSFQLVPFHLLLLIISSIFLTASR